MAYGQWMATMRVN